MLETNRKPTIPALWLLLKLLLLSSQPESSPLLFLVQARTPTAEHVAVGDWNVKVRCGEDFYSSLLFPLTRLQEEDDTTTSHGNKLWPQPSQQYSCQLSLYPNGTFTLQPNTEEKLTLFPRNNNRNNNKPHPSRLALRGRWRIQANPYCITDRFFDELHLESYPRKLIQQKISSQTMPSTTAASTQRNPLAFITRRFADTTTANAKDSCDSRYYIRQRLSLQLHCRVGGRYATPGPWRALQRKGETKTRLTHGRLLWKPAAAKDANYHPRQSTRCNVGASFSGKRMVRPRMFSRYLEEDERRFFGY